MFTTKPNTQKKFNIAFFAVSIIVLVITGFRNVLLPFSHDETATFFYFIQSGKFLPFLSHLDANNHILNSCLAWFSFVLFGDSTFSLRLPNLLALAILILATWKIALHLTHSYSKLTLLAFFLISFNWLGFYSACRGYGLSMSFLLLAISFLMDYFRKGELKSVFLFYLFIQLAISANLILIMVALAFIFPVAIYQFLNKKLFGKKNLLILVAHLAFLFLWIKLSFFYKEANQFYYGSGDSYWEITFVTLIDLITGSSNNMVLLAVLLVFIGVIAISGALNYKSTNTVKQIFSRPSLFYTLMLLMLIFGFYLLKIIMGVNYPEDRTGLFFYLFFVLSLVFTLDLLSANKLKYIALSLVTVAIVHYSVNLNFRKHSLYAYEALPKRFYEKLLQEQESNPERITIGGHRIRELFYAFLNYQNNGGLNLADPPEMMHMNADYYIALKSEQPLYDKYYDELDEDADWGFTLLKRKEPIKRNLAFATDSLEWIEGNGEFYEFFNSSDISLANRNPLLAEFDFTVEKSDPLLKAWLVFTIDCAENENSYYKRIPLNWLKYDWNNTESAKYHLVSGPLPQNITTIKCYLWNGEKQNLKFRLNALKIYQLEGDGISFVAPKAW